jgi:hypothetical protein
MEPAMVVHTEKAAVGDAGAVDGSRKREVVVHSFSPSWEEILPH